MTPIFFNSSSNNYSSYPTDHYEDHLHTHQFLTPISQPSSSSSKSFTTHMFLNSNDENGIFNRDLNEPPQYQHEGCHFVSQAYNDHGIENNNMKGSNDLSTWNKSSNLHQVKWMSSKMRVMLKMKKSDHHHHAMNLNTYNSTSTQVTKLEEHNSPIEETDNSSNSTSSNNNIPIRVCSDCNTTKTPLWRSGPCGPKSLCNACGIRQRKARRAAAAAAAAEENGDRCVYNDQLVMAPLKVTKTLHKDHKKPSKGHVTKYKKRQHSKQMTITPPSSSSPSSLSSPSPSLSPPPPSSYPARKNGVEEFLANLSKNLSTFYHVLPQDEREAAILLMAISCGYAHETEKSI